MSIEKLQAPRAELNHLQSVVQRAEGDKTALPELREALQGPAGHGLIESAGNLARQIERKLIRAMAGNNLHFRECMEEKCRRMRQELAGPHPSPLERLLVERIVTCWLHLHDSEIRLIEASQAQRLTLAQADQWERNLLRFQKMYLAAVKALAEVRKMEAPQLQVNIAQQQVNQMGR